MWRRGVYLSENGTDLGAIQSFNGPISFRLTGGAARVVQHGRGSARSHRLRVFRAMPSVPHHLSSLSLLQPQVSTIMRHQVELTTANPARPIMTLNGPCAARRVRTDAGGIERRTLGTGWR